MIWLSYHVHYQDKDEHDKIIIDYLFPIVLQQYKKREIIKFFFIRYWKGGYHLRLRFLVPKHSYYKTNRNIYNQLNEIFNVKRSKEKKISEIAYKDMKRLQQDSSHDNTQYNNIVIKEKYYREYSRYGGKSNIEYVEDFFSNSSLLIMKLLKEYTPNKNQKYMLSISLMKIIGEVLIKQNIDIENYFENYMKYWKSYFKNNTEYINLISKEIKITKNNAMNIEEFSNILENKKELENISTILYKCKNSLNNNIKYYELTFGLLHMNNNRLGLSIRDEIICSLYLKNYFKYIKLK